MFEIFWEKQDEESLKYGRGILLEEYEGKFGLVAANKSQNGGTIWKQWGYPQTKDKQPRERALPWKVVLGNKAEAIKILEFFLSQLNEEHQNIQQDPNMEDDLPF